jgi:hypothetical protein
MISLIALAVAKVTVTAANVYTAYQVGKTIRKIVKSSNK